jgi:hypothetical protein
MQAATAVLARLPSLAPDVRISWGAYCFCPRCCNEQLVAELPFFTIYYILSILWSTPYIRLSAIAPKTKHYPQQPG